jgi:ribosomal protein S25
MSDVAHHTTKRGGADNKTKKRQTTKPQRAETKPAPHGERIIPVIDPALIKKVNEEILKKSKVCYFPLFRKTNSFFLGRKNC